MALPGLEGIRLADYKRVGGKAARLGEAMALGCPVLPGVVLPTGLFEGFVHGSGLDSEIKSILALMQPRVMVQFQAAAWSISEAFRVRKMPSVISEEIVAAYEQLGAGSVVVRSSATNEDAPARSFVGQHSTIPGVRDAPALIETVRQCWASLYSARALSYAQQFGVDMLSSSMAVLLQPMVAIDVSGALFTVDPITGNADRFTLEIHKGPEAGVFDLDPYMRSPGERAEWSRLRHYGLLLDEAETRYQTLEWIISDGALYIVRARPATGVPTYLPPESRALGQGQKDLVLAAAANKSPRDLQPMSWFHLSRGVERRSPSSRRLRRLRESLPDAREYYPCGYVYCPLDATSTAAGGTRREMIPDLRRLVSVGRHERDTLKVWNEHRQELVRFAELDLATLRRPQVLELMSELAAVSENFDLCLAQLSTHLSPIRMPEFSQGPVDLMDIAGTRAERLARLEQLIVLVSEQPGKRRPPMSSSQKRSAAQRFRQAAQRARARVLRLAKALDAARTLCRVIERDIVCEVGRRLTANSLASSEQDAALLRAQEVREWLIGDLPDDDVVGLVLQRRALARRWARYSPPPRLTTPVPEKSLDSPQAGTVLRGMGVSAGQATGRAHVVLEQLEIGAVRKDEILVCGTPEFELSPLFGQVVALVAEGGALLDHGSVLVREFHLPAVFRVEDATTKIRNGDLLRVDATRGTVTLLEAEPQLTALDLKAFQQAPRL